MSANREDPKIAAVRRFQRLCARRLGVLSPTGFDPPVSLAEARVVHELAAHEATTAADLADRLGLDAGYLSRILGRLEAEGWVHGRRSDGDRRRRILQITAAGKELAAGIDAATEPEIVALLAPLSDAAQDRMIAAMETIERLLDPSPGAPATITIRPHRRGDIGQVVARHAILYGEEYGWDDRFEVLVAHALGDFLRNFDADRFGSWIAERDGDLVGSVFITDEGGGVARLRCLLVEPTARGTGLGGKLVDECIEFCRRKGYAEIVLWTNSVLTTARRLYERRGFELVEEAPHAEFGEELIGETWRLRLDEDRA